MKDQVSAALISKDRDLQLDKSNTTVPNIRTTLDLLELVQNALNNAGLPQNNLDYSESLQIESDNLRLTQIGAN